MSSKPVLFAIVIMLCLGHGARGDAAQVAPDAQPGSARPARPAAPGSPARDDIQSLAPGTRYDPRIPTLASVTGHDFGDEISSPDEIAAYLRALNAAAPTRTSLVGPRARGRAGRCTR